MDTIPNFRLETAMRQLRDLSPAQREARLRASEQKYIRLEQSYHAQREVTMALHKAAAQLSK
jgi:hypothetical protein